MCIAIGTECDTINIVRMPRDCGFVLTRFGVPQSHCLVETPTCKGIPIGTECDTIDRVRMPRDCGFVLPCFGVPQPHRIVPTPTDKRFAIRTERDTIDPTRMPREQCHLLMGCRIVEPNTNTTRHREPSAVRRIRDITRYRPFTEANFGTLG